MPKQVEGLTIPPFHEFYRAIHGKEPSGQLWDVYLASLAINSAMQRLVLLPPGAPTAALETLRAAVLRLNSDKAFAEEALKAMGFVPEYVAGPDTNRQVRQALVLKPGDQGVRRQLRQEREQVAEDNNNTRGADAVSQATPRGCCSALACVVGIASAASRRSRSTRASGSRC